MRNLVRGAVLALPFALGLTSDAHAQVCLSLKNLCDCFTVNSISSDPLDGTSVTRLYATWVNQDCAGSTSAVQGQLRDGVANLAGQLDPDVGIPDTNYLYAFRVSGDPANRVFDTDGFAGVPPPIKLHDDAQYTVVPGSCPPGCPRSADGLIPDQPSYRGH